MAPNKKIICVDFDGVIHWYREGWQEGRIYDEPVPGALSWLKDMANYYAIHIYSSRSIDKELRDKMKDWLMDRLGVAWVNKNLKFPKEKPKAWLTIDDRAWHFEGNFPTARQVEDFLPWNRR